MKIHGSMQKPFSFQKLKQRFPNQIFVVRDENNSGITQAEVRQMGGRGFLLLVANDPFKDEAWLIDASTFPEEAISKLPERILRLR